jgi:hypothetical protein
VDDRKPDQAVEQLEESARLIGGLLAHDRTAALRFLASSSTGGSVTLGAEPAERAIEHLTKAREASTRVIAGPDGPNARGQFVMTTAKLALLYAETRDPRASTFAERAAAEMAQHPIGTAGVEAVARADLARAAALMK